MNRFFKTVLLTGLFVGTTDLVAAYVTQWIKTGNFSEKMLHFIAGGALGLDTAMEGGNGIAFLGLLIHYFIAFSFTLFFRDLSKIKNTFLQQIPGGDALRSFCFQCNEPYYFTVIGLAA